MTFNEAKISREHDFIRHILGDEFLFSNMKNNNKREDSAEILDEAVTMNEEVNNTITAHSDARVDIHEHDHSEKSRHYSKNKHQHQNTYKGRHIHRHEHHHNHKHNHQHDHDGDHQQHHQHHHSGQHQHLHRKELLLNNKVLKFINFHKSIKCSQATMHLPVKQRL